MTSKVGADGNNFTTFLHLSGDALPAHASQRLKGGRHRSPPPTSYAPSRGCLAANKIQNQIPRDHQSDSSIKYFLISLGHVAQEEITLTSDVGMRS